MNLQKNTGFKNMHFLKSEMVSLADWQVLSEGGLICGSAITDVTGVSLPTGVSFVLAASEGSLEVILNEPEEDKNSEDTKNPDEEEAESWRKE